MPLTRMLWYQGVFTERALALSAERGWGFARQLAGRLPAADRGALARALVAVEPGFKAWFVVFAQEEERVAGFDRAGNPTAGADPSA
jgi:hypothetical protein